MNDRVDVDVYFDYTCPYVHSAARWLEEVRRQVGPDRLTINWRFFPLEEVNAPPDAAVAIWDLPPDRRSRGRDSLHAAAAARRQGAAAFERFHSILLGLKHEEGKDHGLRATLEEAAARAELDLEAFRAALEDRSLLHEIRDDYRYGRQTFGIFGTPTFVFPNGQAAYIQVLPAPPQEEAVPLWEDFVTNVRDRPFLREIKRPRRPE